VRSDPAQFDVVAPGSLDAVLSLLAEFPGEFMPIAGGTESMVAFGAGRLQAKKHVSLWGLRELRFITAKAETLTIGAGSTFTDIRRHPIIAGDFPMLALAASWTGSIANQNRGTLGGNIVNGSPAADSPPALLAYGAELELISVRGRRRVAYDGFHLSYKKTALAVDELVYAIHLPRRFEGYIQHARKVGTRNAQAISKVAIAGLALMAGVFIEDIRIGAASLRETPMRCKGVEQTLLGKRVSTEVIEEARAALASEILPIDDIRSTARYRAAIAGSLLEEFLRKLVAAP
jgi:CO/xanthine dehydrogenase FAD-binding subunit